MVVNHNCRKQETSYLVFIQYTLVGLIHCKRKLNIESVWREKLFGGKMVKKWDFGANYWGDGGRILGGGDVWAIIVGMGSNIGGMYPPIPPGFAALKIRLVIY